MSVVKIERFGGEIPSVDDRLLPEHAAAYSRDADLYAGTLVGRRLPIQLFNLVSPTTRKAFRIPQLLTRTGIAEASYWLEFADVNTDVVRTPVIDDTYQRYYFASPSVRPKYNTIDRIAVGQSAWYLGVPTPTAAPAVSPSGASGQGIQTSRSYVYTYVTAYGEESAPSPPLVQNGYLDDTWAVEVTIPDANDRGVNRNIQTTNIYRTVTSANGVATFFLVGTIDASASTYNDSLTDADVAQHVELPSTTWTEPPSDLQGIVQAANGMVVGFRKNEIWFSEPFRPHTFPSIYTLTTEYPIVGLGVCGQSVIVITEGYPVVLTGTSPDSITSHVVHDPEPCLSRSSIVSAPDAVYYASPNGLQAVTPYGTISNTTKKWIFRDQWNALPLVSLRAIMIASEYFAFGSVYVDPATSLETAVQARVGFAIYSPQTGSQDVAAPAGADVSEPALTNLSAPNALDVYNLTNDFWTSIPLLIQNQKVYYYDYATTTPTLVPYLWKSRIYQEQAKRNYAAMKIYFGIPAGTTTQNVTRNTASVQTLAADQYGIVRVYANGVLLTTREIRTSGELLRIASGGKYDFWQFEIEGRVEIYNMQAATNVKELARA